MRAERRPGANMTRNGEAGFSRRLPGKRSAAIATLAAASVLFSQAARADEGGVSLWLPGFFGSLAASPLQPGWSLTSIYYHTSVSAGANVATAREFETGRIPVNLAASVKRASTRRPTSDWPCRPTPSLRRCLAGSLPWVSLEYMAALTPS